MAVVLAGFAFLIAPGMAGAAKSPRVIVTPKPGQVINTHPTETMARVLEETAAGL